MKRLTRQKGRKGLARLKPHLLWVLVVAASAGLGARGEAVTAEAVFDLQSVTVASATAATLSLASWDELLPITYQTGATVEVTAPEAYAAVLVAGAGAAGEHVWRPAQPGAWALTHTVGGETLTATLTVPTALFAAISWKDDDGTLIGTTYVLAGETPSHADLAEKTTAAAYCAFKGWTPEIAAADGDATYTAEYLYTTRKYLVTWKDADGTVLKAEKVDYGAEPEAPDDPSRAADAQYAYTFAGWTPEVAAVAGGATYTATYAVTRREYTITWLDADGTTLATASVAYGRVPLAPEAPEKADDETCSYVFAGWNPSVAAVTGEAAYTATYKGYARPFSVEAALDLDTVPIHGDTANTRRITSWDDLMDLTHEAGATVGVTDPDGGAATIAEADIAAWRGNAPGLWTLAHTLDGAAQYAAFEYTTQLFGTANWREEDGTLIDTTYVNVGDAPTHEALAKDDAAYTYTFAGWTPDPSGVTAAADTAYDFTAQWTKTAKTYTITWLDADGETVLGTDTLAYGAWPEREIAAKAPTEAVEYHGAWSPGVVPVAGDATYTLVYEEAPRVYEVTWLDADGETVLEASDVAYGETPQYWGAEPVKAATAEKTYTFAGWAPEVAAAQGEASYTAVFDEAARDYAITWLDDEGAEIDVTRAAYGTVPRHADASKASTADYDYTFAGWTPEVAAVTGEATYAAVFRVTAHDAGGDPTALTGFATITVFHANGDGSWTLAFEMDAANVSGTITEASFAVKTGTGLKALGDNATFELEDVREADGTVTVTIRITNVTGETRFFTLGAP